jgi:hypothetical protein
VIARRLASQLLSGPPARTPEAVVDRLLAVQAQDPRGMRLAIRSRSAGLTAADVDAALTTRRSLVVTWLNRGTLHLVRSEDYWWLQPLTTPQLATGNARRLRQEGVSPAQADRGVDAVAAAVAEGPQTRAALRERLAATGIPSQGQALIHVLLAASLRGLVVRGPVRAGEQAWVGVRDWLGEPPAPLERDEALARLARRYRGGHAPAEAGDLARWAGIGLGEARRGLAAAGAAGAADGEPPPVPAPRLLGAFDPLLHGWASREPFTGRHGDVVTSNGVFRATALVGGRIVGTWGLARGEVALRPLEDVAAADLAALRDDGTDVLRFLGLGGRSS